MDAAAAEFPPPPKKSNYCCFNVFWEKVECAPFTYLVTPPSRSFSILTCFFLRSFSPQVPLLVPTYILFHALMRPSLSFPLAASTHSYLPKLPCIPGSLTFYMELPPTMCIFLCHQVYLAVPQESPRGSSYAF